MRTGVGRVTIHDVMDGINGRYTEDQFSYTGDPLDEDVWHFPAQSLDKFKRARVIDELGQPIVDGSTDANGWVYTQIAPIKDVDYDDGNNGDTIYEVYQYSVNGIDAWEDDFTDAHKYRRTAVVINGAQSEWSAAARISGEDGANGIQTNILTLYQVKEEKHNWTVGELVQTDETYLIINQTYAGYDAQTGINGWMLDVPAVLNGGEALYQIRIGVLSEAGQLEVAVPADDWAAPVQVSAAGVAGEPGNHGSGSWIIQLPDADNIPSSDSGKDTQLESLANRPAQAGDMITYISDGSVAEADAFTKQYLRDTTSWNQFAFRVDGSAVIEGTLAAQALKSGTAITDILYVANTSSKAELTLSGSGNWIDSGGASHTSNYRQWVGAVNPADAPFRISKLGILETVGAVINGHITAQSMEFVDGASIPTSIDNAVASQDATDKADAALVDANQHTEERIYPDQDEIQIKGNYTPDSSGWAIDSAGNAEFNHAHLRGGAFSSGTITSASIIGSTIYASDTEILADPHGNGTPTFYDWDTSIPVTVLDTVGGNTSGIYNSASEAIWYLLSAADNASEADQRRSKYMEIPADTLTGTYSYPNTYWGVGGRTDLVDDSFCYHTTVYARLRFYNTSGGYEDVIKSFNTGVSSTQTFTHKGVSFTFVFTTYYYDQGTKSGGHQGEDTYYVDGRFGFNLSIKNNLSDLGSLTNSADLNGRFALNVYGANAYWKQRYGSNQYFGMSSRSFSASVSLTNPT